MEDLNQLKLVLDNICAYDTKTNILIDVFLNAVKRLNPEMSGSEAWNNE